MNFLFDRYILFYLLEHDSLEIVRIGSGYRARRKSWQNRKRDGRDETVTAGKIHVPAMQVRLYQNVVSIFVYLIYERNISHISLQG